MMSDIETGPSDTMIREHLDLQVAFDARKSEYETMRQNPAGMDVFVEMARRRMNRASRMLAGFERQHGLRN
jgi:hypothetical protein